MRVSNGNSNFVMRRSLRKMHKVGDTENVNGLNCGGIDRIAQQSTQLPNLKEKWARPKRVLHTSHLNRPSLRQSVQISEPTNNKLKPPQTSIFSTLETLCTKSPKISQLLHTHPLPQSQLSKISSILASKFASCPQFQQPAQLENAVCELLSRKRELARSEALCRDRERLIGGMLDERIKALEEIIRS